MPQHPASPLVLNSRTDHLKNSSLRKNKSETSMKNRRINRWVSMVLIMCSACGATTKTESGSPNRQQEMMTTPARGTATIDELAQTLFGAIQAADISAMDPYFLTETEISALKKKGSRDLEAMLSALSPEQIREQFKSDYAQLIEQSVTRNINWAEVILAESIPQKQTGQDQTLLPVEMVLTDRANKQFQIVFEAVELDGRYFLFRRLAYA
jgi:hypothetical protein